MKWNTLPLGEFIKAKKLLARVGELITPLYGEALPEDPEAVVSKAQEAWSGFMSLAAPEGSDVERDVSKLSLSGLQELIQSFFVTQVGPVQK